MWRYVFLLLALVTAVPLVSGLQVPLPAAETAEEEGPVGGQETSGRIHKVRMSPNGHFFTEARLNGRTAQVLIDTGATTVAMPETVARKAGVHLKPADYTAAVNTANGRTRAAPVTLREVRLGSIRLKNVRAMVLDDKSLSVTLLGMSVLRRLDRFDISDDTLVLVQ